MDLRQGSPGELTGLLIIKHLTAAFQHPVPPGLSGLGSHLRRHSLAGRKSFCAQEQNEAGRSGLHD